MRTWIQCTKPWSYPEVFLACGRNFWCGSKADTSSAIGGSHEQPSTGHYKDLTETRNCARKVSGTQGILSKLHALAWCSMYVNDVCYPAPLLFILHRKLYVVPQKVIRYSLIIILHKKRTHINQLTSLVEVRVFHWRSLLAVVLTALVCQLAVSGNPFLSIRWQNSVKQRIVSQ